MGFIVGSLTSVEKIEIGSCVVFITRSIIISIIEIRFGDVRIRGQNIREDLRAELGRKFCE